MQEIVNSNSNSNVFKVPENCLIPTLNGFMLAKDLKQGILLPTNSLPVKVESVMLSNHLEVAYTLHYSNRSYIQTFEPNIKAVRTLQIANFPNQQTKNLSVELFFTKKMLKNLDVPVFENHATRTDFIKQLKQYNSSMQVNVVELESFKPSYKDKLAFMCASLGFVGYHKPKKSATFYIEPNNNKIIPTTFQQSQECQQRVVEITVPAQNIFIGQFIPYYNEIPIVSLDQCFKGFATTNVFHNFNISGLPTRMADCVKINFKDGRSIVCEENVEWKVNKRVGLVKSQNLVKSMSVVQNAIEFGEKELPVSPYVVGAHLGDGSSQAYPVVITSIDLEIVERCAKELNCTAVKVDKYNWKFKPNFPYYTKWLNSRDLFEKIPECRTLHNYTKIPNEYKYGSIQQRQELIQGLIDTDGHVGSQGEVSYCSYSMDLINDFVEVVNSLGLGASVKSYGRKNNVSVSGKEKVNLVGLSRKKNAIDVDKLREYGNAIVKSVEFVGAMEVVDLSGSVFVNGIVVEGV